MNSLLVILAKLAHVLLFQKLSTEEGEPYQPYDGPDWILILVAVVVLSVLVFVLLKVFRGLQRSRDSETDKEEADSPATPEK